jgi:hypothetical protein
MKFDVQKIDERIKKLQELRRIATDPEISSIISEFMTVDDEYSRPEPPAIVAPIDKPGPESTNDLVNDVVHGAESPSNGGLWSRRRG